MRTAHFQSYRLHPMQIWALSALFSFSFSALATLAPMRLSFDPVEYVRMLEVGEAEPFSFYLLIESHVGVVGWEGRIVLPDSGLTVLARVLLGAPDPLDVGFGDDNWIVGLAICRPWQGEAIQLLRYDLELTPGAPRDLRIELRSATPPSSNGGVGWVGCNEYLYASWGTTETSLWINSSASATAPQEIASSLLASPNPFSATSTFSFSLQHPATVFIGIFDLRGRLVRTLSGGLLEASATHQLLWDGRDDVGEAVGNGVYFGQLRTGSGTHGLVRVLRLK